MSLKQFAGIRTLSICTCATLISLLAACGTPNGGYYDANGNYIATDTPHNMSNNSHAPLPGGTRSYRSRMEREDGNYPSSKRYTRRGYYDYNGYYIDQNSGLNVPENMYPPQGMCRIWFAERAAAEQPGIESCDNINSRAPARSYIIYGG